MSGAVEGLRFSLLVKKVTNWLPWGLAYDLRYLGKRKWPVLLERVTGQALHVSGQRMGRSEGLRGATLSHRPFQHQEGRALGTEVRLAVHL